MIVPGPLLWRFRVRGLPVAWAAAKRSLVKTPAGGFLVKARPAEKWADWKRTVQAQAAPSAPSALFDGPLALVVRVYLPRPTSAPKRVTIPTKRPDLTNLQKGVEDALTGIVWVDDSQVVRMESSKEFGDPPGVMIEVRRADLALDSCAPADYPVTDE